jgi:hypothetical protein
MTMQTTMNSPITAQCRCGAVRFTSQRPPILQRYCHCTNCQESTGRPFARTALFKAQHSAVSGPLAVRAYNRTTWESCADCGSLMFDRSAGFPALIGVVAERISAPFVFEPAGHDWTSSTQSNVTILDDARRYAETVAPELPNNVLQETCEHARA